MSTPNQLSANPPVDQIRLGSIRAAIWANTDDQGRTRYSATLERMYHDEAEGKWKSTSSFGRDELLTVAKVADLANTRIHALLAADRARDAVESNGSADVGTPKASKPPKAR